MNDERPLSYQQVAYEDELAQHDLIDQADNVLKVADIAGVGVYAREASEYAPDADREEDTVIVVLRGEAARRGREALVGVADLVRS